VNCVSCERLLIGKQRKYCSRQCLDSTLRPRQRLVCKDCGIDLEKYQHALCVDCVKGRSIERGRVRTDGCLGAQRECQHCGGPFHVRASGQVHCSRRCGREWQRLNRKPRIPRLRPPKECKHPFCCNFYRGSTEYCCAEHSDGYARNHLWQGPRSKSGSRFTSHKQCPICGSAFRAFHSNMATFCSKACVPNKSRTALKHLPAGQRRPKWCSPAKRARFARSKPFPWWHTDHVVPLRAKLVSGLDVLGNLQHLPPWLNVAKSNKFEPKWEILRPDLLW
jgi:hypothetical protein